MVTLDSNIAIYALSKGEKADQADKILQSVDFLSIQVLNEYANVARRKLGYSWQDIATDIDLLKVAGKQIVPVDQSSNRNAIRLAERYMLEFYDALLIAVALANGASKLYSEDMHHGLIVDSQLTIINPFNPADPT
jgi:predicted nucleic acid-binding protein